MRKLFIMLLFFACLSYSHQPRIVFGTGVTGIINPEVSQAFYGELNGSPAFFEIRSDKPFELYVGILIPALEGESKDKSVNVTMEGKQIIFLDATNSNWSYFYEEFGGDGYYSGPDSRMNVSAGTFRIEVFSPTNKGKYSFVVGEKEEFPIGESINALILLPTLKSWFFNKSPLEAFISLVYIFTLGPVILVAGFIAAFAYWFFKSRKKKQNGRATSSNTPRKKNFIFI